jgi:hypothetical protein
MKKDRLPDLRERAYDLTLELFRSVFCDAEAPEFELSVQIRKAAQDMVRQLSPDVALEDALDVASGAVARLESLLLLAQDLKLFPGADLVDFQERARDLGKAIRKMISKLRASGS